MSESSKLVSGTSRSTKTAQVVVKINVESVRLATEVATTVILQKFGDSLGCTKEQITEVNTVGLTAALMKAVDDAVKIPLGVVIPAYFDEMTKGLRTKIGRTVVIAAVDQNLKVVMPDHYKETVAKMKAAGITFVKPHSAVADSSQTLAFSIEEIDGVSIVVGNAKDTEISDLVRRCLIDMSEKDRKLLKELSGELALQYGELDELITDFFAAGARVAFSGC